MLFQGWLLFCETTVHTNGPIWLCTYRDHLFVSVLVIETCDDTQKMYIHVASLACLYCRDSANKNIM